MVDESAPRRVELVIPWPLRLDARHGGRAIAQLLLRLTERHRVAVVYLRHPGAEEFDPRLAERCDRVVAAGEDRPSAGESRWRRRAANLVAPLSGIPLPVAALRSRALTATAVSVAREWRPDVVQVEHDNLAYVGTALRESGSRAARILVCHEPGPLASADQAAAARGRRRLAHRLDVHAWHRFWSTNLPAFDAIVTLTEEDRRLVAAAADGPAVSAIGLGTEIPEEPLDPVGRNGVVFVGGYRHPPNADAALRLLTEIMPRVRRSHPGARLTIVGAEPGEALRAAAGADDEVTGTVADVTPYLDRAQLFALPIRLGGGMRVKLLEGLAAGKAVVASPLAAAGLDPPPGVLESAESDAEFAAAIARLLGDDDARRELGRRARSWATENLSWDARVRRYEELYARTLNGRD